MSGRFVIVQMDNGHDALNLKEVKAFGQSGNITKINLFVKEKEKYKVSKNHWVCAVFDFFWFRQRNITIHSLFGSPCSTLPAKWIFTL